MLRYFLLFLALLTFSAPPAQAQAPRSYENEDAWTQGHRDGQQAADGFRPLWFGIGLASSFAGAYVADGIVENYGYMSGSVIGGGFGYASVRRWGDGDVPDDRRIYLDKRDRGKKYTRGWRSGYRDRKVYEQRKSALIGTLSGIGIVAAYVLAR